MNIADTALTFALLASLAWLGAAIARCVQARLGLVQWSEGYVRTLRNGALTGSFAFVAIFSAYYYFDVDMCRPSGLSPRALSGGGAVGIESGDSAGAVHQASLRIAPKQQEWGLTTTVAGK